MPIEEKREPAGDIDTAVGDRLKLLDPKPPIRQADIATASHMSANDPKRTSSPSPYEASEIGFVRTVRERGYFHAPQSYQQSSLFSQRRLDMLVLIRYAALL